MKKIILQGAVIILLFVGAWFALTQIDWVKIFHIQEITDKTEEKLGDLFWESFRQTAAENDNEHVIMPIERMVTHICEANNIDSETIHVHVLNSDEINAFALPNRHLVLYRGLILNSDNPEELAGVLCHEIAHIELNHVMKKLIKEVGLSVLISMTTGNSGPEIITETSRILSSSAFDRSLEKEADIKAVDYLLKAKVNPEPFAHFLYKLSFDENKAAKYLTWISTHPDSKERATYIVEHSKNKSNDYQQILSEETWEKLQEELVNVAEPAQYRDL